MFGSAILDVLIGLITIFLLLSFCATAIREGFESMIKARAVMLERGIRELLDDPDGTGATRPFYEHPQIYPLFQGDYRWKDRRRLGRNLPTYIPSRNFALAVLDMAGRRQGASVYSAARTAPVDTIADLRAGVGRLPGARLRHAVLTAIDEAGGDHEKVRTNIEAWFDASMDRVSGWYKRRTHAWLFVIGAALAGALNVNTIAIANHLSHDRAARDSLVSHAGTLPTDAAGASQALASLDLPIGWDHLPRRGPNTGAFDYWFQVVAGILVTALAVTLGAPFWFDTLNRVMVIRSTVKPHEKSGEEASQDRQPPVTAQSTTQSSTTTTTTGTTTGTSTSTTSGASAGTSASSPPVVDPGFTPREWAVGIADEGVL